jgi:hypothetical protein
VDDPALRCEDAGVSFATARQLPLRVSDAERERVLRRLRAGRISERLSLETFVERVDRAYAAKNHAQLSELVADLPHVGLVERAVVAGVTSLSRWTATVEWAWHKSRVPTLVLPTRERAVVGRSRDCDCVLCEATVSRRHASVRHDGERWWVADLGSLNGTWLNGRRVVDEAEVRPGDEIAFGDAAFTLASAAPERTVASA